MAVKRKSQPAPPQPTPQSFSSSEELSDEEEVEQQQVAAKPSPSKLGSSRMQAYSDPESKDDPADSSDEDQSDEEEEKEAVLVAEQAKKPEAEPAKKKQKSAPSSSQSSGKSTRIFRPEDEQALIQTLLDFHSKKNRAPTPKECESFFDSLKRKINTDITPKQLGNKMRAFRDSYNARKKKGAKKKKGTSEISDMAILQMCEKLWGGKEVKLAKKEGTSKKKGMPKKEKLSQDVPLDVASSEEEEYHEIANTVKDASGFPYLMNAIAELSKRNQGLSLLYKNGFELMGEAKARIFEAIFKKLQYNNVKVVADKIDLEYKLSKKLVKAGK